MLTSLNKFGKLSLGNRRLLIQSFLLLPMIHVTLFFLGYTRLLEIMEKLTPLKDINAEYSEAWILQRASDITRIVTIAARRGLYKATCLRKSILVWWFLRKEKIRSEICFGVRMVNRKLEAHAWVEHNGTVINDSASVHENYQILRDVFPSTNSGL